MFFMVMIIIINQHGFLRENTGNYRLNVDVESDWRNKFWDNNYRKNFVDAFIKFKY